MGRTLAICNVPESSLVRETALRFITRAGPEIRVASTKAFTTQLAALYLLTLVLAKLRNRLDATTEAKEMKALRHVPAAVQKVLALEPEIKAWAQCFADKQHTLFLGRGRHYPIALEGALKLRKYPTSTPRPTRPANSSTGHWRWSTKEMPVIAVAPNDALLEKLKSNLQEVRTAVANCSCSPMPIRKLLLLKGACPAPAGALRRTIGAAACRAAATAFLPRGAGQGTDVDKPRNLAKSVTVE